MTGSNTELRRVLWSAAASSRLEWYLNNQRVRHWLGTDTLPLLASGSTSNESLHHEINGWFRQIQTMHQSTMALKLRVLTLRKQLPHFSAMCWPTTQQLSPDVVLVRSIGRPLWSEAQWVTWCQQLDGVGARVLKAHLPMEEARRREIAQLAAWSLKRPASASMHKAPRKRTPFTRVRQDKLVRGGIRHCIFAKPSTSSVMKKPAGTVQKKPAGAR